jgi:transcriptional regulator GlxA family with amidase domain
VHVVVYLPSSFYSAIASTAVETLQAVNEVRGSDAFTYEFVAKRRRARSKSGVLFPARLRPSRKMDALILLAGLRPDMRDTLRLLDAETRYTTPLIRLAQRQGALIAATCGASFFLAASGLLDGKRATISWWLKEQARLRFPQIHWTPSRLVVREGRLYTSGAAFAGLELITTLVGDLGFGKEERQVRKLMVFPPSRDLQTPYEILAPEEASPFQTRLNALAEQLRKLNVGFLARHLGASARTLARRFSAEYHTTPGKWIQQKRLEAARTLLETTRLGISEICFRVGYEDPASFGRLFSRTTGMTPGEFRKQLQSHVIAAPAPRRRPGRSDRPRARG